MIADYAAAIKYFVDAEQLATRIGVRDLEARIWWRTGVSSSITSTAACWYSVCRAIPWIG